EPAPAAATPPPPPSTASSLPLLSRAAIEKHQRDAIVAALERSGGRVSGPRGAAELLGMKASTLFSRMAVLGLRQRSTSNSRAYRGASRSANSTTTDRPSPAEV